MFCLFIVAFLKKIVFICITFSFFNNMGTKILRSKHLVNKACTLLLTIIAGAAFNACFSNKATSPDSINWWFRNGMVSGDIKSIDFGFYTAYYDKNGREIHFKSSVDETFNEYDSDGLLTKETRIDIDRGDTIVEETVYEYNNKGKFVQPLLNDVEGFAYFNYDYLIPDLSRVVMTTTRNGEMTHSGEINYEFHGDRMLRIHFGHNNTNRDTTVVIYKGDYPYECTRDKYCFGPVSYQENGMFSEFRRVFKNYDGSTNREVTINYRNINGRMLPDKEVVNDSFSGTRTIYYTYDDKGNPIREIIFRADDTPEIAEYSYVFDSKGNWTQKTSMFTDPDGNQLGKPRTETRTIEYW